MAVLINTFRSSLGAKMAPEFVKLVIFRVKPTNSTLLLFKQRGCAAPHRPLVAEPARVKVSVAPRVVLPVHSTTAVPEG